MTDAHDDAERTDAANEASETNDVSTSDTNEESSEDVSKAPQVARIIASVALLAVTAVGIGIAAGWGTPSEPLSVAPPTAYASSSATQTTTLTPASTTPGASTVTENPTTAEPEPTAPEDTGPATDLDITTGSSVTVLVNKRVPLNPPDYAPEGLVFMDEIGVSSINDHALRQDAALAVKDLFAGAAAAGFVLDMTSGYRDYDLQTKLYNGYVEEQGQEAADSTSARPGFSEHQTGLAADISAPDSDPFCILEECFGDTAAGRWLAENAWEYGFIVRYPEGQASVTGYAYEPWHFRFIGVDAAAEFHASGASTYEEFLRADPAPDYE